MFAPLAVGQIENMGFRRLFTWRMAMAVAPRYWKTSSLSRVA